MKVKSFEGTDTLCIRAGGTTDTRGLDENTSLGLDDQERICAMTMEHALSTH